MSSMVAPPPDFDLAAFLSRIGLDGSEELRPDLQSLRKVVGATVLALPFENLDPALGRGVDVTPSAVFKKLVVHRRGGYCFENNMLMHMALLALGFAVVRRLGRVVLGGLERPQGKTHMVNLVRIDGETFLVGELRPRPARGDGDGPATRRVGAPILFYPDAYRLVEDCGEASLMQGALRMQVFHSRAWAKAGMPDISSEEGQSFWRDQYAFHPEQPVAENDILVGNYYVATCPAESNIFTNTRMVIQLTREGRVILQGRRLSRERRTNSQDLRAIFPGTRHEEAEASVPPVTRTMEQVTDEDWLDVLGKEFSVDLRWDYRSGEEVPVKVDDFLPGALASDAEMF